KQRICAATKCARWARPETLSRTPRRSKIQPRPEQSYRPISLALHPIDSVRRGASPFEWPFGLGPFQSPEVSPKRKTPSHVSHSPSPSPVPPRPLGLAPRSMRLHDSPSPAGPARWPGATPGAPKRPANRRRADGGDGGIRGGSGGRYGDRLRVDLVSL